MKRKLLAVLLFVLVGAGAMYCASGAESAELSFSSFDGGGPEYSVAIDDPTIVAYAQYKVYDNIDHEIMMGSGYKVIFTFTGLKLGETRLTISARSPIAENFDALYTVTVDEALNVTIRYVQTISRFSLYRNGEIAYDSYEIVMFEDGYRVSVNGEEFFPLDPAVVDALCGVYERYNLAQWDGFDGERTDVQDGEGFLLEIEMTDGASVSSRGENAFPERYFDAIGEMQKILDGIERPSTTLLEVLRRFLSGL